MTIGHLYLDQPAVVFSGQVNQTEFTYPIASVAFDGGVGLGPVVEGQTVVFGSAVGYSDKGRQRVRAGSDIDGATGTLNFGRSSRGVLDGEVDLADDVYFTIYDDNRVWAVAPNEDGFPAYKDHEIPVGDLMTESPPVANIGGPKDAGFAATGTGTPLTAAVALDGSGSFATAEGATITDYAWDVGDGTITTGTDSDASIVATFPVGFRRVRLTVTDSNGLSHTQSYPVLVRDPALHMTVAHQVTNRVRRGDGQEISFRILEDIPALDYPDGMLVMYWEGEPASPSDRSHMQFVGWHHTDPSEIHAERTATLKDTVLNCLDAAGKLKTLPGFPQVVGRAEDGYADWQAAPAGNRHMDWFVWYLLHWHSTVLDVVYWSWSGTTTDYPFVVMGSDGESLFEQVNRKCNSLVPDYHLTCTRQGGLQTVADPMLLPVDDRTATVQLALTESKWTDISYEQTTPPRVHWLWGDAIIATSAPANGNIPTAFCVSPGRAPGQGLSPQDHGEQLAISQEALNINEGNRYARLNAPQTTYTIALASAADANSIEPADLTWVTLSISAANAARRGLALSSSRGLPLEVVYRYDYRREGTLISGELLWERETSGEPAATYFPPPPVDIPPWEPPPYDWNPPPPGGGSEGTGLGTALRLANNHVGMTSDLSAGSSCHWVSKMGNLAEAGPTIYDLILDPWRPSTHCWISTSDGLYRTENYRAETPVWTQIDSSLGITRIHGSINIDGYFGGVFIDSNIVYWRYTTNGGASWNTTQVVAGPSFPSFVAIANPFSGIGVYAPAGQPHIMVTFSTQQSFVYRGRIWKSTNGGITFSEVSILYDVVSGFGSIINPHQAYDNNENGNFWITALNHPAGNTGGLYSTSNGGANWAAYSALGAADFAGFRGAFEPHTFNRQLIYAWIHAGGGEYHLWTSEDGGANWTQATEIGLSGTVYAGGGLPFNEGRSYASTSAGVFYSNDKGETFVNCTGDWAWGHAVGGGHVIVPDWTE